MDVLAWAIQLAPEEMLCSRGGWTKMIGLVLNMLGWSAAGAASQRHAPKATKDRSSEQLKAINNLKLYFDAGFANAESTDSLRGNHWPLAQANSHTIATSGDAYRYLNLYEPGEELLSENTYERAERQLAYDSYLRSSIEAGIASAKLLSGEIGRSAAALEKVINRGMADFRKESLKG